MARLIINADDFGSFEGVNRAVEKSIREGALRSTTIMAGGNAFDDAVEVARRNPSLGVGVHLTLVRGRPVLTKDEIPSLVDENGMFYEDYGAFIKKYLTGRVSLDEIRSELSAQIRKAEAAKIDITHVDSHQHMHVLPGILGIVIGIARDAGIKAMRVPSASIFLGSATNGIGQLIGRTGLFTLSEIARMRAKLAHINSPEHFDGIVAGEAVSEEYMMYAIENLHGGTTEIMVHPGDDNAALQKSADWEHDFEKELNSITSEKVMKLIESKKVELISFRDIRK